MDLRPDQPPPQPRRRPRLGEIMPLLLALTGAGALLAVFVGLILLANTVRLPDL